MKKFIRCATSRESIKAADYIERLWANDAEAAGFHVYVDTDMNVSAKPKKNTDDMPTFTVDTIQDDRELRFEVELDFPKLASTESGIMDGLDDFTYIVEKWQKIADLAALISESTINLDDIED